MKNILYTILAVIIIVAAIAFIFGDSKKLAAESKTTTTDNLVNGTAADWRKATQDEKIAVCARFVANLKKSEPEKTFTTEEMEKTTLYLYECMEPAVGKDGYDEMKLTEIAAGCLILYKSKK